MPDYRGISPEVNDGADLGSASQKWARLYMTDAGLANLQNDFSSDAAAHNSIFRGKELPYTWAEIKAKVQAGDFSDLYIGDYKQITLTTNETVAMEIAGINCYKNWGSTAIGNHIDFVSRDLLATGYQFNTEETNNGISTMTYPWAASALYDTLGNNDYNSGVYITLPSDLQSVLTGKLAYCEQRYSPGGLVSADTGAGWLTMGRLWIPSEIEVFGHASYSENGHGTMGFIQYPIFRLAPSHIIKRASGSRWNWWLLSADRTSSNYVCSVAAEGIAGRAPANVTTRRVPLCFRIAA